MSSLVFPCGGSCTLVVREDLPELEAAAKKFEQDDSVLGILGCGRNEDLHVLSTLFPTEQDGYFPYCEINFELDSGACYPRDLPTPVEFISDDCPLSTTTTDNITNASDMSLCCAASTLCFLQANCSQTDSVRWIFFHLLFLIFHPRLYVTKC